MKQLDSKGKVKYFLTGVQETLGVRDKEYGDPTRSFMRIADLWSTYLDTAITPEDVANMMILMKVSRNKTVLKEDNWIDIAGYSTLGALMTYDVAPALTPLSEDLDEHGIPTTRKERK